MLESPPEKRRQSGSFLAAVLIGWAVLGPAGMWYARLKSIPNWAALPLLAAFLAEYPFYLAVAYPAVRERFAGPNLPAYVTFSALLPYFLASMGASRFSWWGLIVLAALALAMGLWYRVLPASTIPDLAFLALIPASLLGGYFQVVFVPLFGGVRSELAFLGHFILIQMSIIVLMLGRGMRQTGFGFFPTGREWRIGAFQFACFAVVGLPLALAIGAVRWKAPAPLWTIIGTFLGFLWVVALSEEFFFRGVLQKWLEDWTRSGAAALAVTSALFGLIHLGYKGFPNWRWVFVAALLGWFCGRARNLAGGIRAGVVTHALAVATWRAFFS